MKREVSNGEFEFGIHEVYYDDDGKVEGYTDSLVPVVESVDGLKHELEIMMKAFEKEVILFEDDE